MKKRILSALLCACISMSYITVMAKDNKEIAVFAFAMIAVYMMKRHKPYIMSLAPGALY